MSTKVTYQIPNIHCMHCVHTVKMEISDLPGVKSVEVDQTSKMASITFDSPATEEAIKQRLVEINYPAAD